MSRHSAGTAPRRDDALDALLRSSLRAEADEVRPDLGRAHAELVRRVEVGAAERRRRTLRGGRFRAVAVPVLAAGLAAAVTAVVMGPRTTAPAPAPTTATVVAPPDLRPDSSPSPSPSPRQVRSPRPEPPPSRTPDAGTPNTAGPPAAPRGEVPGPGQVVGTLELAVDDPATWVRRCGRGVPVRATVLVPPDTGELTYHWYLNLGGTAKYRSPERTLPVDRSSDTLERVALRYTFAISGGNAEYISMGLLITREADGVMASGPVLWIPMDCSS